MDILIPGILVTFALLRPKYLREQLIRRKDLFGLMVSDVSVHLGGESVVEQRSSHYGAKRQSGGEYRKKGRTPSVLLSLTRPHLLLFTTSTNTQSP
jgi:hypothetical protein